MTALGGDAPNVVGLVYIAAFGLDEGESIGALLQQGPPTPALAHLNIDNQGLAWLPEDDYVNHFAADIDPVKAKVMHAVQQPLAASTLGDVMGAPAWKSLPTWFLVASGDQAIPPDAERQFAKRMGATTVEVPSNHCAMISHPMNSSRSSRLGSSSSHPSSDWRGMPPASPSCPLCIQRFQQFPDAHPDSFASSLSNCWISGGKRLIHSQPRRSSIPRRVATRARPV